MVASTDLPRTYSSLVNRMIVMTSLLDLLAQLVAVNSINPTLMGGPGEAEIASWIDRWLRAAGVESWMVDAADGRPNVIARIPGQSVAPPLLLNAHIDTVGVDGMSEPFTLRVEGDRLYGRGAYDMKGSVAVMLWLAEHFTASPPPGDLWLTFVSDEEDLSIGSEALVRSWLPTLSEPPAAAIVLEPTEEGIGIAHKGFAWYELTTAGRAAHGSRPAEGIDAILPLGAALRELEALAKELGESSPHPILGHPSLHASTIQGGTAWSIYPAQALLRWERRTLPHESRAQLEGELGRVVAAASEVNDSSIEGKVVFSRSSLGTADDAPVVQLFRQLLPNNSLIGLPFWTDGALFSEAGIPTVIYGPIGHGAHAVDEWVSLASLERVADTVARVIERGASTRV